MFLNHFGLIEQPFGVTPDPRFLHMGVKHREALASLLYGTDCNRGFLALIAEPGMGKTSLLYQYLEGLRNKARTVFVFQTDCDSRDFMRHVLADLGLDHSGKSLPAMQAMLNELLTAEMQAGRRFVLVVDEAQNLEEKVLESVRLLSNFETPWMKLMQIVISGQPQLAERLTRPSMAQLRQRISSVIRIEPFTPEEINSYIDHRLWVAGYAGAPLFTVGARLSIAKYSRGIPRNINTLCFNAMSVAFGMNAKQIDAKMVQEAAADVEMESLLPKPQKVLRVVMPKRAAAPLRVSRPTATPRIQPRANPYRASRMVPAFATFCALMLLATFEWVAWDRGERTPAFDVLMASNAQDGRGAAESDRTDTTTAMDLPVDAINQADAYADIAPYATPGQPTVSEATRGALDGPVPVNNLRALLPAATRPLAGVPTDTSVIAGRSQNDEILTVVVEKEVTVRQLAMQYVGRFDENVLSEIYTLNPGLRDAAHIEIDQRLRLPLYLQRDFKAAKLDPVRSASVQAQRDTP